MGKHKKAPFLTVPAVRTFNKQATEVTWKKRKTMTIVCIKSNFVCGISSFISSGDIQICVPFGGSIVSKK